MALDETALRRRAEIARRLKAARWLAGSVAANERGETGYKVTQLSPEDLARRGRLAENAITATLIGAIERMERHTPPMELEAIADALGVPRSWFELEVAPVENGELSDTALSRAAAQLAPQLLAAARALRQEPGPGLRDADAPDP
jgi:transcriptional regulator with XRE-family HTH domain